MIYLDSFKFPTQEQEERFFGSEYFVPADIYPWRLLSSKYFHQIDCENITILYGGNGSGKSTALNAIAQKIGVERTTPYNRGYYHYDKFIDLCSCITNPSIHRNLKSITKMITSDEILDTIIDTRKNNLQHELRHSALADFYKDTPIIRSIDCESPESIESYIRSVNARNNSQRSFIRNEIGDKQRLYSNGETGYLRMIKHINEGLYLLDEPENSLSARWQSKLAEFIKLSAHSCNCQFIIATHSPFLLAIEGAKIYNLDDDYVTLTEWHELESTKLYFELFSRLAGKL